MLRCAATAALVVGLVLPATLRAAEPNTLTAEELAEGWILLFDGETLYGWKATSEANWAVREGTITVSQGEKGFLHTASQFGDFELKLDFRSPPRTNSGVFLRTSPRPQDPTRDCYELNIADVGTTEFPTGSFVGRKRAAGEYDTEGWQTFHVTARGGEFRVAVDGQRALQYTDPRPLGRGYIALQFNEGPVEFRNIKLRPLGTQPLFNGRDLAGWRVFPDRPSQFQVTPQGEIQVLNGPGQLETEAQFRDFVLQLEIFVGGKHLNSGIFFRNLPGQLWQGYESQIHNGYADDRTQPLDFGTGGFYRRQPARKVMADDLTWFSKTLVVCDRHMATWVNGYLVCEWTDTRAEHENPRQGLRLEPGTIALQGHDPTTSLRFRQLRIAEIPPRGK
jgi:hypothetical protein